MHPTTICDVCKKEVRIKNTYKQPTGQKVCGRCMRSKRRKSDSQKDMIEITKRREIGSITKDEQKELWRLYNTKQISHSEMCRRMKNLKTGVAEVRKKARIQQYYLDKEAKSFKKEFQKLKKKK